MLRPMDFQVVSPANVRTSPWRTGVWAKISGHYLGTVDTVLFCLLNQCGPSLTHWSLSYCPHTMPLMCHIQGVLNSNDSDNNN